MGSPYDNVNYGAGPTGGMDDIDDWYSGKAGANSADDAGKVRKTYHGGVRPDHMMFASIAHEKAISQKPAICCPNCHGPVKELDSAQPKYEKPEGLDDPAPLHFVLHPCGCKVHPEWAAAFTKELNRRMEGEIPLPVVPFKPEELDAKVRSLEERITDLYAQRDQTQGEPRRRLEYYLVIAVDELMRLVPGAHNTLPQIGSLDPEVEVWAAKNKMSTPPKKSSEFGYPSGYKNPLAAKPVPGVTVPLTNAATDSQLYSGEAAMHIDPVVAAKGQEQLKKQQVAAQIVMMGGMLSRRTLAELFNIDISAEQEAMAKELAQTAKAGDVNDLGHSDKPLYPGLQTLPEGPVPAGTAQPKPKWDAGMLTAAREFMDKHNLLCCQLINEQILHQPHHDTRHAASWLVTIKRSIDSHLKLGSAICPEATTLLAVLVGVLLPATGMVPTKPGPSTDLPLPVSAEELKEDFHAKFAPIKRRIVRKTGEGE